jgi:hypothetical protein
VFDLLRDRSPGGWPAACDGTVKPAFSAAATEMGGTMCFTWRNATSCALAGASEPFDVGYQRPWRVRHQ